MVDDVYLLAILGPLSNVFDTVISMLKTQSVTAIINQEPVRKYFKYMWLKNTDWGFNDLNIIKLPYVIFIDVLHQVFFHVILFSSKQITCIMYKEKLI